MIANSVSGGGTGTVTGVDLKTETVNFSYNSPVPLNLYNLLANDRIDKIEVTIDVPFDDSSATLELGTVADPDLIFAVGEIKPDRAGTYSCEENPLIALNEILRLLINPGASTQGSGAVLISIRR